MQQFGTASVYGVTGDITAGFNVNVMAESIEGEQNAQIDEFMSGMNQLIGFYKSNERIVKDLLLVPKADTLAHALNALQFPVGPCKVVLANCQGDGTGGIRDVNGPYIYTAGARRTYVKGQAQFRVQVFRPLDAPVTYLSSGVLTLTGLGNYIDFLVTPVT